MSRSICAALVTLALLQGCTLSRPLARHAVSYNRTVEDAQNQMLLLNIVRAKERMPMYFTSIGGITTSVGYTIDSGSLSLTDPVTTTVTRAVKGNEVTDTKADGRGDTWTLGIPSFSYSDKPTVQISVLDSQEFMSGTLTAVKPETVYYYWEQGWKAEVLIYLLVENIRLGSDLSKKICPDLSDEERGELIENDPDSEAAFAKFEQCVNGFLRSRCHIDLTSRLTDLGSTPVAGAADVSSLISSHDKGFVVTTKVDGEGGETTRLQRREAQLTLVCDSYEAGVATPRQDPGATEIRVVFRSPRGVLYYLGEIARAWAEGRTGQVPKIHVEDARGNVSATPLFVVRKASECGEALVQVDYRDQSYVVPAPSVVGDGGACEPGRSMQALTLVSQLISLQKSAKELPGPALVRVVGQ